MLPSSGQISLSQIVTEYGYSIVTPLSTAAIAAGISSVNGYAFSEFYGLSGFSFVSVSNPGDRMVGEHYSHDFYVTVFGVPRTFSISYQIRKSDGIMYQSTSESFTWSPGTNIKATFGNIGIINNGAPQYNCTLALVCQTSPWYETIVADGTFNITL